MRFITLALEGYGRFRERTVFEFDAGLTCIVGANESGKSTVLAALLDALYTLPTSTAQAVRERIHWGHPHGWTLELDLTLRGERVRIRKFHPIDEPRRRAEFVLEHNGETLSGEAARERWEQLWRVPFACVSRNRVRRPARRRTPRKRRPQIPAAATARERGERRPQPHPDRAAKRATPPAPRHRTRPEPPA
jgi:hypothetical protein